MFSQVVLRRESNFIILIFFFDSKSYVFAGYLAPRIQFQNFDLFFATKVPHQNSLQNDVLNSPPSLC